MTKYHVSEDGMPRVCKASSPASCTARGVDGEAAPHGDFSSPDDARRFAEAVLEKSVGSDSLEGTRSSDEQVAESYPLQHTELRLTFEEGPLSFGSLQPATEAEMRRWSMRHFFRDNSLEDGQILHDPYDLSDDRVAYVRQGDQYYRAELKNTVPNRAAFSTDMADESKYRVENGRLRVEFEAQDYDLGELKEISQDEANSWSQETFSEDVDLQDGEVFPVYNEEGEEAGAYARFGDRYYRASVR